MRKCASRLHVSATVFLIGLLFIYRRWGQDVTIIKGLSNGYMAISSGSDDEIRSALRSDLQQDKQTDIQSNIQSDIHMPVHYIHTKIAMSNTSTSNVSSLHDNNSSYQSLTVIRSDCKKVNHFAMIKTEKTGSSSLFSILARYIMSNKLNVMVMTKGGHIDVRASQGAKPGWDIGPTKGAKADALAHHSRYNETLLSKVMHADTRYITLVRDAASWYQSAIRFWPGQVKFKSPDETLNSSELFYQSRSLLKDDYNGQHTLFHIPQLQWLGFNYSLRQNLTAIKQYIHDTVPKFHTVYLTDQFEASLILMRRDFCWDHADIFYKAQEVGGRKQSSKSQSLLPLTPQGRAQLIGEDYNLGDQLLYEAFNQSWWSREDTSSTDLWNEVEYFRETNEMVNSKCAILKSKGGEFIIPANQWSREVKLDKTYCSALLYENYSLIKDLAKYAIGKLYDPHI